jgi:hypothetical protein
MRTKIQVGTILRPGVTFYTHTHTHTYTDTDTDTDTDTHTLSLRPEVTALPPKFFFCKRTSLYYSSYV